MYLLKIEEPALIFTSAASAFPGLSIVLLDDAIMHL